MGMSYEQKMDFLSRVRPEKKDELLLRIWKGEKVDITKDEDLFFQVNKDRVSLTEFTNRDKFKQEADNVRIKKQTLHDTKHATSRGKKLRWLGDIPAEVYFARKEFSPMLDKQERDANIRKFLNQFPSFRAGEVKL